MPDATVAEPEVAPAKEHHKTREARERREAAEAAAKSATVASSPPEAPPAPPLPSVAAPASVIDALRNRRLLTPDEFIALNSDPGAVTQFSGHTNAAASYADSMSIAYTAYLLMRSPAFSAWYKAEMAAGRVAKQILPDPTLCDRMYDIAAGK